MTKSIKVMPKKSRGRPATGKNPQVVVRMEAPLITAVDGWASTHGTVRSEAIRRLVKIGLQAPLKTSPTERLKNAREFVSAGNAKK